eukprot:Protomagalhaensia_wolfi_Nauph_80__4058@NODE_411_length_2573_cov_45_191792_g308_i0_p5_GENE_NODE_411_length_2573_cov_45_191792_g308_i0NODE_411_length_2573_cov_45_191792_g308_i0_p5_ORF_typecomplete_len107_score1_03DUF3959/PF13105_6/0_016_NODE_411_length_2573_cov_45_191792_g308_i0145465
MTLRCDTHPMNQYTSRTIPNQEAWIIHQSLCTMNIGQWTFLITRLSIFALSIHHLWNIRQTNCIMIIHQMIFILTIRQWIHMVILIRRLINTNCPRLHTRMESLSI